MCNYELTTHQTIAYINSYISMRVIIPKVCLGMFAGKQSRQIIFRGKMFEKNVQLRELFLRGGGISQGNLTRREIHRGLEEISWKEDSAKGCS